MTWGDLLEDWQMRIDRLTELFPHADAVALQRFRGNKSLLAQYIADTHDLTLSEGYEALDMRLLPGCQGTSSDRGLCAAE